MASSTKLLRAARNLQERRSLERVVMEPKKDARAKTTQEKPVDRKCQVDLDKAPTSPQPKTEDVQDDSGRQLLND